MIDRVFDAERSSRVALIAQEPYGTITYGELADRVGEWRRQMRLLDGPLHGWLLCDNSPALVCAYLAALAESVPVGLADAASDQSNAFVSTYAPSFVVQPAGRVLPQGYGIVWTSPDGAVLAARLRGTAYEHPLHPRLALLLTTSGSTGNAKVVRLSQANLEANALSIAEYLGLDAGEVAVQSLPMQYSYGLSLINSHLVAGAAVALTNASFMRPEYWGFFDRAGCTSFAGVPYVYETLQRLRWKPAARPTLRTLTQAGGHLKPEAVMYFHEAALAAGRRLFVMYGQTEATARIAYVPPERLAEKRGSIGIAIPRGELSLAPVEGSELRQMLYRGPNVMLGYATGPQDLALGDVLGGELVTGDLAEIDADGFYRITGRLARFAKLFGRRVQLGDLETRVETGTGLSAAAIEGDNAIEVFVARATPEQVAAIRADLAGFLAVTPVAIKVISLDQLPLTASGKKNYPALRF